MMAVCVCEEFTRWNESELSTECEMKESGRVDTKEDGVDCLNDDD
jgi:hypothetical protein